MRTLLAALALALPAAPALAQRVPVTPVRLQHDRLFVPASVAGHRVEALLDSGAEMSVIDRAYAAALGLRSKGGETLHGSGGTAQVQFVEGVDLRVGGKLLKGLTLVVADLSDISRRLNGGKPIRLIVGREFFDAGRWEIDLVAGTLRPGADRPAGVRVPLTTVNGIEGMPVSIEGHPPVTAAFDLGNGSDVLVAKAYADRIGLSARATGTRAGGGIGGSVDRPLVTIGRLTLGGRTFTNVQAAIDSSDKAEDVNIGTRLLRRFRLTVDYTAHALWLAPVQPPARAAK